MPWIYQPYYNQNLDINTINRDANAIINRLC